MCPLFAIIITIVADGVGVSDVYVVDADVDVGVAAVALTVIAIPFFPTCYNCIHDAECGWNISSERAHAHTHTHTLNERKA